MPVAYTVRCSFTEGDVADAWATWLREAHLADVCDAGASHAILVRLDGEPVTYEARYTFPDRATFDAYVRDHAPRLRDEGLSRFPLARGLTYSRTVGEVEAVAAPRG